LGRGACGMRHLVPYLLLVGIGCSSPEGPSAPDAITRGADAPSPWDLDPLVFLELAPGRITIQPFYSYQVKLVLTGTTRSGERRVVTGARWSSSAPEIAPIDSVSGAFSPGKPGISIVSARLDGLSASAEVTVLTLCRPNIWVIGPARLRVGERGQWTGGVCQGRPGSELPIRFSSLDSTIIAIDSLGHGIARRVGFTGITVSHPVFGSASVGTQVVADSA
jgi:hypothetical protein